MRTTETGFTLIELVIVIAIIGILAALAIPSYNAYVAKSQMTEAFNLGDGLKTPLMVYYANGGSCKSLDGNNRAAGAADANDISGQYVKSAVFGANCDITVTLKSAGGVSGRIADTTVTLQAGYNTNGGFEKLPTARANQINPSTIVWQCSSTARARYLPNACHGIP